MQQLPAPPLPVLPLAALAFALLFAACGDDDPAIDSASSSEPAQSEGPDGTLSPSSPPPPSSSSGGESGAHGTTDNTTQRPTPTEDETSSPPWTEPSAGEHTWRTSERPPPSDGLPTEPSGEPSGEPPSEPSTADVQACLDACGIGCPAPEFQPCGVDGNRYCNTCIMGCYGIDEAPDAERCEPPQNACALPASRVHLPLIFWEAPGDCSDITLDTFRIWDDEDELRTAMRCAPEDELGIDFTAERLLRLVIQDNFSIEAWGVQETVDGQALIAYARAPVYCGGARPPTAALWLILPADGRNVRPDVCLYGDCGSGPPRP